MTQISTHIIGKKSIRIRRTEKPIQFMGHIEFGMLSKGCKNFGICRIEPIADLLFDKENKKFNNVKTLGLIKVKEGHKVEIFFLLKGMEKKIEKLYFGREKFMVGEDVEFEAQCHCYTPPFSKVGRIKKGSYKIEKRPWGFWVAFHK